MKILIVDDNPDDRRVLKYMVERKGHVAIEAEDGFTGLKKARASMPDLIISDALMPVMDGFQFLREVKQEPLLSSVPFIFYSSAYKDYQDVRLAISLGADKYVIKPVEPLELWDTVDALLKRGRQEKIPPRPLVEEDAEYLKQYSRVVASKLEEKVQQLEREIEDRINAEEALRKSETFVRNILESVDEGFIVIDRNFKILSANRAYARAIGKSEESVIGRYCYEVSHRSGRPCFECGEVCAPKISFATGEPQQALHKHIDAEGREVFVETKAYPMKDAAGHVDSVIEVVIDVTEKTKLEEQLRQAQKMEAIGTLAGGVAHDFNNILTAIMGYGNMVKMKMATDDPQRASVDQILAASERAAHLTQGLLTFSRKQVIKPRPVDLNEVVKNVEKLLRRMIGEDVLLSVRYADIPLVTMADTGQIEQILMNLATNARDAMPKGGELVIATSEFVMSEDFVAAHGYGKPGTYGVITVSDTGHGMDEQTQAKIFEPFFTTKELGKGTGLGLSIVYGIVRQHEGNISVSSEPGKGTSFTIYLPRISAAACDMQPDLAAKPAGGTETILLAEDDASVRELIRNILQEFGYRVIEATDGQDALDKYWQHERDIRLLLLDVIMPKRGGRDVYDIIKVTRPNIVTLFMSGYAADIIQKKGALDENLQFISKPVSPFELLKKIRALLDNGK